MMTRSAPYEKSKFLGSGGSMVARLKLKEIDGRAPPGVNSAVNSAPDSSLNEVGGVPEVLVWAAPAAGTRQATRLNCGDLSKHSNTKLQAERQQWPV